MKNVAPRGPSGRAKIPHNDGERCLTMVPRGAAGERQLTSAPIAAVPSAHLCNTFCGCRSQLYLQSMLLLYFRCSVRLRAAV